MKIYFLGSLLLWSSSLVAQNTKTHLKPNEKTGADTEWNNQVELKNISIEGAKNVVIVYPFNGSTFPADISPASFRWKSLNPAIKSWNLTFKTTERTFKKTSDTTYLKPEIAFWEELKKTSHFQPIRLLLESGDKKEAATIEIRFSKDSVKAPIFYRAVELPFRHADKFRDRLEWYLGDVVTNQKHKMLDKMPVCANCHSFTRDGSTFGMDVDYANDKGNYTISAIRKQSVINLTDIISWSDYKKEDSVKTFGLLAQLSPDGKFAVSTVKDRSIFVPIDNNFWYSQLFFPVKGILAYYNRTTGQIKSLKGADDPAFVQSAPVWEPGNKEIMFCRARCSVDTTIDKSTNLVLDLKYAADYISGKKDFKFDLYRIPWNNGDGGSALPVEGASGNNKSNYFAKYSPDGKWIVFCQARNFMLLQPDSRLYIMPAAGGKPRLMNCNQDEMNSWHSFSPNGKWMVFSTKHFGAYTQLFLTHIDENGNDTPPVWLEQLTVDKKAANIPEFVNVDYNQWGGISDGFSDTDLYREDLMTTTLTSGNFTASLLLAEKEIKKNPENFYGYYARGRTMFNSNSQKIQFTHIQIMADFNKAIELLNKEIAKDGSKPVPYAYIAASYFFTKQYDKSLANCQKSLEIKPNDAFVWQTLAGIYYELSDLPNTLKANRKLFDITRNSDYIYRCAQIKFVRKMYPEAIEDANLALSVERCDNMALEVLGNCYLALGDKARAEKYYSDIIGCNPTDAKSYFPRGNYYLGQREYHRAIEDLSKYIELDGSNLTVLTMRASAFISLNTIDKAIPDLSNAATLGGDNDVYFMLAKCYMEKKEFSKALDSAKKSKDLIFNSKTFGSDSFKNLSDINKIIDDCKDKLK